MSAGPKRPTRAQLSALARRDPALAKAARGLPPFPGFPEPRAHDSNFHALAKAIVFQQLAGRAAQTIHDRVVALTPGTRFPLPEQILELSDAELRGAGLSRNKLLALRDLSGRITAGELSVRSLGRRSDAEVIEALTAVRGIGVWSAQIFLMFRLGRLDVLPAGDLGLRDGLRRLDGCEDRPTSAELEARGARWAPLRSVAAWRLWRLADAPL